MNATTNTSGPIFHARPGQVAYGYPIGMLCAQWNIPFVPGDLNNAATFDFPMRYLEVDGVSGAEVLRGGGDAFTELLIDGARRLEAEGVRAITGNCGFMAICQDDVAEAVDVPVFLSSLLQVPMLTTMLGRHRRLGVLAANSAALTPTVLAGARITDLDRIAIGGLERQPHFRDVILEETGTLDLALMTREIVETAIELQRETPDLGAFLLECSDLPVYSSAIREATGLPVFDWASYINYVERATNPQPYSAGIC